MVPKRPLQYLNKFEALVFEERVGDVHVWVARVHPSASAEPSILVDGSCSGLEQDRERVICDTIADALMNDWVKASERGDVPVGVYQTRILIGFPFKPERAVYSPVMLTGQRREIADRKLSVSVQHYHATGRPLVGISAITARMKARVTETRFVHENNLVEREMEKPSGIVLADGDPVQSDAPAPRVEPFPRKKRNRAKTR